MWLSKGSWDAEIIQVDTRSDHMYINVSQVYIRGRKIWPQTDIEEGDVKMEVEIGMIWPQAKGCQYPPESGRGKK